MIKTERLSIVPFEMSYLKNYFDEFNSEITQYQYPNPFESIDDAKSTLQEFINEMDRGETLIFSILSKNEEFIGSIEVHSLTENYPELGIWICSEEQNKGYAYEAFNAVLEYVNAKYNKSVFFYEADVRNIGSLKLLFKFSEKYEIIKQELEKLTTYSGKYLELQKYILKAR